MVYQHSTDFVKVILMYPLKLVSKTQSQIFLTKALLLFSFWTKMTDKANVYYLDFLG